MAEAGESVRTSCSRRRDCGCAPTCRSGRSSPAASTRARSSRRWPSRRRTACETFSIGFDVASVRRDRATRGRSPSATTPSITSSGSRRTRSSVLPRLVWHYGEPFADSSALPTFYLAELTRRHVTVALNGDGGDESFAGYTPYLAQCPQRAAPGTSTAAAPDARGVRSAHRSRWRDGHVPQPRDPGARGARSTRTGSATTPGCPTSPAPTSTSSTRRSSRPALPTPRPADRLIRRPVAALRCARRRSGRCSTSMSRPTSRATCW